MFRTTFAVTAISLGLIALPPPAEAQSVCMKRDTLVAQLTQQFGELRRGAGLGSAQMLIEVWVSGDTGSWTILLTRPDGTSCVVATGDDWQDGTEPAANDRPA